MHRLNCQQQAQLRVVIKLVVGNGCQLTRRRQPRLCLGSFASQLRFLGIALRFNCVFLRNANRILQLGSNRFDHRPR